MSILCPYFHTFVLIIAQNCSNMAKICVFWPYLNNFELLWAQKYENMDKELTLGIYIKMPCDNGYCRYIFNFFMKIGHLWPYLGPPESLMFLDVF